MKKILLFTAALCCFVLTRAQLTGIELETVIEHGDVELTTADASTVNLDGYTTYRVWANTTSATDFVSAVYGDGGEVSYLFSDGDMWQSTFGGPTSNEVSCLFYALDEALQYDSWITIGKIDNCTDGTLTAIGGNDTDPSFTDTFEATGAFELSGVTGGLWFTLNDEFALGAPNAENKVLLGQFTTNGCLFGEFYVQTFIDGDGSNAINQNFTFGSCAGEIPGCTDDTALNYDATATIDDNSCLFPCAIVLDGEISANGPTCSYLEDGSIQLTVTGSQEFTEYEILDSGNPPLAIGNFSGLANGTYTVQVTDAVCGNEDYPEYPAITFEVEVLTPDIMIDISVAQDVLCFGASDGELTGTVTGGTEPIMYGLTEGTYTQDNLNFTGVDNGTQIVFAQDANGCLAESNAVVVDTPFPFDITGTTFPASCFDTEDGTLQLGYSGGTGAPEDICWSVDGGDPICGENIFEGITSGDHIVTATDANGCADEVTLTVESPDEITLDLLEETGVTCNGDEDGAIAFGAIGGNGVFLYDFGGSGQSVVTTYADLDAGDYDLVVTDGNDCVAEFVVNIPEPDVVSFVVNVTDISCFGEEDGVIEIVDAAGGSGSYEYSTDGVDFGESNLFTGLADGDYDPTVQDENGCEGADTATVNEPDEITATFVTELESAEDACDGTITATVEGGTPDYTISWSGPDSYTGSGAEITGLCDGDYFISVVDDNGCTYDNDGDAVEVVVTVEELENGVNLVIFPNPSNGQYIMNLEGLSGQKISFDIMDMSGRIVESVETVASGVQYTRQINLVGEADGIYMMHMTVGNAVTSVRLIKQ